MKDEKNSFILVDVSDLNGKEYWELADWLEEKKIPFVDADFNKIEKE